MPKAHMFVDGFDDNEFDTQVWTKGGLNQEVGRRLELTIPADANYSGYTSRSRWDLTGSYFHVEVVQPPSGGHPVQAFLKAAAVQGPATKLYLHVGNGTVDCWYRVAGVVTDVATTPHDPVLHRWLRLHENSGVTYWEASPDGRSWNVLASRPTPSTSRRCRRSSGPRR